jgi:hypothetical protein
MLTTTAGLVLKRANSFYKEIFLEFFSTPAHGERRRKGRSTETNICTPIPAP